MKKKILIVIGVIFVILVVLAIIGSQDEFPNNYKGKELSNHYVCVKGNYEAHYSKNDNTLSVKEIYNIPDSMSEEEIKEKLEVISLGNKASKGAVTNLKENQIISTYSFEDEDVNEILGEYLTSKENQEYTCEEEN